MKLLGLEAVSSILGCLGLFHHPKHMLCALPGFFPHWLGGFLLFQQLRVLPK